MNEVAGKLDDCDICESWRREPPAEAAGGSGSEGNFGPTGVGIPTTVLIKIGWCLLWLSINAASRRVKARAPEGADPCGHGEICQKPLRGPNAHDAVNYLL